jgi:hypothetical protein
VGILDKKEVKLQEDSIREPVEFLILQRSEEKGGKNLPQKDREKPFLSPSRKRKMALAFITIVTVIACIAVSFLQDLFLLCQLLWPGLFSMALCIVDGSMFEKRCRKERSTG